jgi:tetratricopeptide (TPR) repeat protein
LVVTSQLFTSHVDILKYTARWLRTRLSQREVNTDSAPALSDPFTQNWTAHIEEIQAARQRGVAPAELKARCLRALSVVDRRAAHQWSYLQDNLGLAESECEEPGHLERAITAWKAVLEVRSCDMDPEGWARTQHNLGAAYVQDAEGRRLERLAQGVKHFEAALTVRTAERYPEQCEHTRHDLGQALALIEQEQKCTDQEIVPSLELLCRAVQLVSNKRNPRLFAQLSMKLGSCLLSDKFVSPENIERAIVALTNAAHAYDSLNDDENAVAALCELAQAHRRRPDGSGLDNVEQALLLYDLALSCLSREKSPENWARIQANRGKTFAERVGLEEGVFEPFTVADAEDPGMSMLTMQSNVFDNQQRAIRAYREALSVFRRRTHPLDWAQIMSDLGTVYAERQQGDRSNNMERAIRLSRGALCVLNPISDATVYANASANLGRAYVARKRGERDANLREAQKHLSVSLQLESRESDPFSWAHRTHSLAQVLLLAGKHEGDFYNVVGSLQQSLEVFTAAEFPRQRMHALADLATAWKRLHRFEDAHAALREACKIADDLRDTTTSDEARNAVAVQSSGLRTELVNVSLKLGFVREAFEQAERGRSQLLARQLGELRLTAPPNLPRSLIDEENELLSLHRLAQQHVTASNSTIERNRALAKVSQLQSRLAILWDMMEDDYGAHAYVRRRKGVPLDWADVQAALTLLSQDTVIVMLWHAQDYMTAFVLKATFDEPRALILPSVDNLRSAAHDIALWPELSEEQRQAALRTWQAAGNEHASQLVPHLASAPLLCIVPAAEHYEIPWHALDVDERALFEICPIVYAPSVTVALRDPARPSLTREELFQNMVVVGNATGDLPGAEAEASVVSSVVGIEPLLGGAATKLSVMDALSGAQSAHFAGHGDFAPVMTLESGVALADGTLHARDILLQNLDLAFVALSGCATGKVRASTGDEVSGVARAFMYAGTQNVLVSLWDLHDETAAALMCRFYGVLEQQTGKLNYPAALQCAMTEMRRIQPEPCYWAPFVIFGVLN